jgi:hypothetical protein
VLDPAANSEMPLDAVNSDALAADAERVNDVDFVADVLDAGQVANGFLYQLFEVERRQPAGKKQSLSPVLDSQTSEPAAEMRMAFEMLFGQCGQVGPFRGARRWKFG